MAKRKITVTIDEELVDQLKNLGGENVSAVVNQALGEHVERLERLEALSRMIDDWDRELGPTSPESQASAKAAFDEVDGIDLRATA